MHQFLDGFWVLELFYLFGLADTSSFTAADSEGMFTMPAKLPGAQSTRDPLFPLILK